MEFNKLVSGLVQSSYNWTHPVRATSSWVKNLLTRCGEQQSSHVPL